MGNFDYLKKENTFDSFSDIAVSAEKMIGIDNDSCVLSCRKAMEIAVKWMYSVDHDLQMPFQDSLSVLMNTEEFRDIVDDSIWQRMEYIRKLGNLAAHSSKKLSKEQTELCFENLLYF